MHTTVTITRVIVSTIHSTTSISFVTQSQNRLSGHGIDLQTLLTCSTSFVMGRETSSTMVSVFV